MRALIPILALLATGCPKDKDGEDTGWVTWYHDAQPIVEGRCVGCHVEGGIAPFSLVNYEDAVPWTDVIASKVQDREMPVWKAAEGCNDYQHDPSLSDEQIQTLVDWAAFAGLQGDPENPGAPVLSVAPSLSRVDLSLPMPEAYTPTGSADDYRCFPMDWTGGSTYVTGIGITPGSPAEVHHVIVFNAAAADATTLAAWDAASAEPGYPCFGGPGMDGASEQVEAEWLGAWVPGTTGSDFPAGTGIAVAEDSSIVLQVHYNLDNGSSPDQTEVSFRLDDSVDAEAHIARLKDPTWPQDPESMLIPAGDASVTHSYAYTVPADITLYLGGLHMHTLGKSGRIWVEHADGSEDCFVSIDDWDFHWQGTFELLDPISVTAGDVINIECTWDNSSGTEDVGWGEGTSDEMCLGTGYYTVNP